MATQQPTSGNAGVASAAPKPADIITVTAAMKVKKLGAGKVEITMGDETFEGTEMPDGRIIRGQRIRIGNRIVRGAE
jgi:hypothetical protein